MPKTIPCPCGASLRLADESAARKLRCPKCQALVDVPAEPIGAYQLADAPPASPTKRSRASKRAAATEDAPAPLRRPASKRPARRRIDFRSSLLWSLGWGVFGFNLALLVPWLGLMPEGLLWFLNRLAPLITAGLIGWNLVESFRLVRRTGETLSALPLTLVQAGLFTLLFFQICCHLGAANYSWQATPRWYDWLAYTGLHAFRAADIVDALEAYGLHTGIQSIHHETWMTALCLMAYHLVLDVFFLSLIVEWLEPIKAGLAGNDERARNRRITGFVLLFVAVWFVSAMFVRPWLWRDIFVWPLDNLIRVVDFVDAMEIFHVRLHQVPRAGWEGTLTFMCRLIMGAILLNSVARLSRRLRLQHLGGFGLDRNELETLVEDWHDRDLKALAERRLAELNEARRKDRIAWLRFASLSPMAKSLALAYAVLLILGAIVFSRWTGPVNDLAAAAAAGDDRSPRAHAALRRMGSYAESGAPVLADALARTPREQQLQLLDTIARLGERGRAVVQEKLDGSDEELALAVVRALEAHGPEATPALVRGLGSPLPAVRRATATAFLSMGPPVVPGLIQKATTANSAEVYALLEQLDPYWHLNRSDNKAFQDMVQVRQHLKVMREDMRSNEGRRQQGRPRGHFAGALLELSKLGARAAPALPFFVEQLEHDTWGWTVVAIADLKEAGVPTLIRLLDDSRHREHTLKLLSDQSVSPALVIVLIQKLAQADARANQPEQTKWQEQLTDALKKLLGSSVGPESIGTLLAPLFEDTDDQLRYRAVWAVGQFHHTPGYRSPALDGMRDALRKLTQDSQPGIRTAALYALDRHLPDWRTAK